MKTVIVVMIMTLTACTSSNQYGKCIGVNDEPNPKLSYRYNVWNISMGIIFFGFVAPPLYVIFDEIQCPTGVIHE
jgi:hypothetical protein